MISHKDMSISLAELARSGIVQMLHDDSLCQSLACGTTTIIGMPEVDAILEEALVEGIPLCSSALPALLAHVRDFDGDTIRLAHLDELPCSGIVAMAAHPACLHIELHQCCATVEPMDDEVCLEPALQHGDRLSSAVKASACPPRMSISCSRCFQSHRSAAAAGGTTPIHWIGRACQVATARGKRVYSVTIEKCAGEWDLAELLQLAWSPALAQLALVQCTVRCDSPLLFALSALCTLNLRHCDGVTDTLLQHLLAEPAPALTHVDLHATAITGQGVVLLAQACPRLCYLDVSDTRCADSELAQAMQAAPNLCQVDVSNVPALTPGIWDLLTSVRLGGAVKRHIHCAGSGADAIDEALAARLESECNIQVHTSGTLAEPAAFKAM